MRLVVLLLLVASLAGCQPDRREEACCDHAGILFGRPNRRTGLPETRCQPRCPGLHGFAPPDYDAEHIASLLAFRLVDPPAPLTSDPYERPGEVGVDAEPDAVCAVLKLRPGSRDYRLVDYPSEHAARAQGAIPTHFGHCGLCSSLHDLAVYMRENDLTRAVKRCGLEHPRSAREGDVRCLVELGFTLPCAQIWAYNTRNTERVCAAPCVEDLVARYHRPDGTLNACLQCDEDRSGPVFKAVAGRTRRNTGLPNAMCRPCSEVRPLLHRYE